jgi:integrase
MRHVRAAWNTFSKEHELPVCPTIAVLWNKGQRRQEPIPWSELPGWYKKISVLEPIIKKGERVGARPGVRGDYHLLTLLTGLRKMDAATVRWEHVDLEKRTLRRPNPKGGEDRAFTIPISRECVRLFERRQRENAELFEDGDGGWVSRRGPSETSLVTCASSSGSASDTWPARSCISSKARSSMSIRSSARR